MKKGFTLAEVLITLTIIGVIAAITIPNLMRKWSDHADVQKVKEAYSILNNAFKMAVSENGDISNWAIFSSSANSQTNVRIIQDKLKPYLKVSKDCYSSDGVGSCFKTYWPASSRVKNMQGAFDGPLIVGSYGYNAAMILQNGMSVAFYADVAPSSAWFKQYNDKGIGYVMVDINGLKEPNKGGYDIFYFMYGLNGIISTVKKDPSGTTAVCSNTFGTAFCASACNKTAASSSGISCSSWIMKHGNMDYKYRDVSAEW